MRRFQPKGYYEAKLQLRPKNTELFNFISHEINKLDCKIVDVDLRREGYDIYIDSHKVAARIARDFNKKYKKKPKITKSLKSLDKQRGKRIYRFTVLLKVS